VTSHPDYEFDGHQSYVIDLVFNADSSNLITGGMDNVIKIWSTDSWQPLKQIEAHKNSVNSIALSPDGSLLASGSSDNTVALWDFPELKLRHRLRDRKKVVSNVKFSPDGEWIAAGSYGGRVMIWTIDGQEVLGIPASKKNLSCIAFSPNQELLATSGLGDDIKIWDLSSGENLAAFSGHEVAVISLHFIQAGKQLVSLGYEQSLKFWDTQNWKLIREYETCYEKTRGLALSPDEQILVEVSEGKVLLREQETGDNIAEVPVGTKALYGVAFSPDGEWMGVGAADGKVRLWNLPGLLADRTQSA
jgi:WD40 repeat protein